MIEYIITYIYIYGFSMWHNLSMYSKYSGSIVFYLIFQGKYWHVLSLSLFCFFLRVLTPSRRLGRLGILQPNTHHPATSSPQMWDSHDLKWAILLGITSDNCVTTEKHLLMHSMPPIYSFILDNSQQRLNTLYALGVYIEVHKRILSFFIFPLRFQNKYEIPWIVKDRQTDTDRQVQWHQMTTR